MVRPGVYGHSNTMPIKIDSRTECGIVVGTFIGIIPDILYLRDNMMNKCLAKCVFWNECDKLELLKYKSIQLEFEEEKSWCPSLRFPSHHGIEEESH